MKKLVRWFLIWGTVCCLIGVGAVTAGVMMGGLAEIGAYVKQSPLYSRVEYEQDYEQNYEQNDEQNGEQNDEQDYEQVYEQDDEHENQNPGSQTVEGQTMDQEDESEKQNP